MQIQILSIKKRALQNIVRLSINNKSQSPYFIITLYYKITNFI